MKMKTTSRRSWTTPCVRGLHEQHDTEQTSLDLPLCKICLGVIIRDLVDLLVYDEK